MIISVWRYSHLSLAVSSFLLLTLASISGIILAFEPVQNRFSAYHTAALDTATLAHVVPLVKEQFSGIQQLSVDERRFVIISWTNRNGNIQKSCIDPATAAVLGTPGNKAPLFQWMTTLHRSLFMHETGRMIVGITAFLLALIALSGIALVVQRQKGFRRFFASIEKTGFSQYYHVIFGRLALFPILALAITGSYLSLSRFVIKPAKPQVSIDNDHLAEDPVITPATFPLFRQTKLSEVETLDFPFSEFPEDYFTLKLKDGQMCINQFTGDIIAEKRYSTTYTLANLSLNLHTGRSGFIWALVLAISAGYILFFIYSGFVITFQRTKNTRKNKYKPGESSIIILVGSENGSTYRFAASVYQQLLLHGQKVYMTDMNNYSLYPQATHLVIMTSTYGLGDAPFNARQFAARLKKYPQQQSLSTSVVGFGSRSYAQFCQFAVATAALLHTQEWAKPALDLVTVNDKSPQDFSHWLTAWSQHVGITLPLSRELLSPHMADLKKITVTHKIENLADDTMLLRLTCPKGVKVASGDLLAVYPKNDHRERLYSIGKVGRNMQLSVRLHVHGLGSSFLHQLQQGQTIQARIIKNQHFHLPSQATKVIMIANGTGIAPFLGMIQDNKKRKQLLLYCGFRNQLSYSLYHPLLSEALQAGRLQQLTPCFSREAQKQYVMHALEKDSRQISDALASGGTIMICGSLSMERDVMAVLDTICRQRLATGIDAYKAAGKILTDCY